jgi:Pyruvate/2-oxoacid:ferredoxin oxidoreductase delta subunit
MKRPIIIPEKCQACDECAIEAHCPKHAVIREQPNEKPWVDFYKCSGCLKCKTWCRNSAVEELSRPCDNSGRRGC